MIFCGYVRIRVRMLTGNFKLTWILWLNLPLIGQTANVLSWCTGNISAVSVSLPKVGIIMEKDVSSHLCVLQMLDWGVEMSFRVHCWMWRNQAAAQKLHIYSPTAFPPLLLKTKGRTQTKSERKWAANVTEQQKQNNWNALNVGSSSSVGRIFRSTCQLTAETHSGVQSATELLNTSRVWLRTWEDTRTRNHSAVPFARKPLGRCIISTDTCASTRTQTHSAARSVGCASDSSTACINTWQCSTGERSPTVVRFERRRLGKSRIWKITWVFIPVQLFSLW